MEWQPIETAPRGSGENGPSDMRHPDYVNPPKLLLWTQEGPVVGYYDWYYHEGYGNGAEPGVSAWRDHNGEPTYGATHWMPLPSLRSTAGLGATSCPLAMAIRCRNKNYQGQWTPWLLCSLRLWQGEEAAQRALEDWPADEKELVRLYDLTPNYK